ncbi:MAG: hypothetical protein NVS1B11_10850 [Terriglobales bacterium]
MNKKPIPWVKSPDGVFEAYSNMTHIVWSLDDVRVRLGQIIAALRHLTPALILRPLVRNAWR